MGDFNFDLLNYAPDNNTFDFLNTIIESGFLPLIHQPTSITETTGTLIVPWIRGSKERSSQNSHSQDERAKGEEPLVTLDHNLVLKPVRLHVKLLCQDKRGAPI